MERGRREGTFRADAWHLSMLMALVHAASAELRAGRLAADQIEPPPVATGLGALSPAPSK
jgi:hypothetical protein